MKKKILSLFLAMLCIISLLSGCGGKETENAKENTSGKGKTPVTLNEVAHSIFYAPMYVAIEEGYFAEEGIELTLVTGFGADKTMTALLTDEADIGFMGSESTIYTYIGGSSDYAVNFAQLTQRAGNFLVAREPIENFDWSMLIGNFGSTAAAFSGGQGEFTVEFEPHATSLEAKGDGYVVASLGEDSGYVPYTAFSAKKSYIEENPEVIQSFTNALQKGMNYVQTHSAEEIAKVIQPQFAETDLETITTIVERYAAQETWKSDLIFEEDSFTLLQNILEEAGELEKRVPYEDLVNTDFASKAAEK